MLQEAPSFHRYENQEVSDPMEEIRHFGRTGVFGAHPDDAEFLMGGTLSLAAKDNDVIVVTATKGEKGGEVHNWTEEQTAEKREAEQKTALETLGITSHNQHWLGYTDGTLTTIDPQQAVDRMMWYMEEFDLETVITFGPDGVTGHDDHKKAHELATDAFKKFRKKDAKLYHIATPRDWTSGASKNALDTMNFFYPGYPSIQWRNDHELQMLLSDDVLDLKIDALMKHHSQYAHVLPKIPEDQLRNILRKERLVRVPVHYETNPKETILYARM